MRFETETGWLTPHIETLVIAGWTGRDAAGVQHHIDELQAIGIPAPSDTPLYYRVGANLLTQSQHVQVLGSDSSGEVEPLVLQDKGQLWLGLGSDHTDRKLEAVSVAASKQVCPKPIASALWAFDSVADHLDDLVMSSDIFEDGTWVSYQSGHLSAIRPLDELIRGAGLQDEQAMMCGTLPAIGGVRPAPRFRASLHDPHTKQTLSLDYTTTALPIVA